MRKLFLIILICAFANMTMADDFTAVSTPGTVKLKEDVIVKIDTVVSTETTGRQINVQREKLVAMIAQLQAALAALDAKAVEVDKVADAVELDK